MFYHVLTGNGGTGDLEPVLLWENSDPTATFAAQTISLDLTDYVGVIIEYNEDNSAHQTITGRLYCKKTDNYDRYVGAGFVADGNAIYARNVVNVDNSGVEFGSAYNNGTINSQTTHIPVRIYGVKAQVVEPQIGDLLWTNPNPTTAMANIDVEIDTSEYEYIQVNSNDGSVIINGRGALYSTDGVYIRAVSKYNDHVGFGNGMSWATAATDSTKLIPISIVGIKSIS